MKVSRANSAIDKRITGRRAYASMTGDYPERIVCLTDETAETLYLLGEDRRIVGISGFTVRPERARREKPIVCSFTEARINEIVDLDPDLVLGFSDLQAKIASQLVAVGIGVHVFNHRSVAGILQMIRVLGGMVGCQRKAEELVASLDAGLQQVACRNRGGDRPRVYFEEWDSPLITGIGWVSELIEIAGGVDIFSELAAEKLAKNRIIVDPAEVVRRDPDIIIASWCGKPSQPEQLVVRDDWNQISAVRTRQVHEIDASIILQPGPAALTAGIHELQRLVAGWHDRPRKSMQAPSTGE